MCFQAASQGTISSWSEKFYIQPGFMPNTVYNIYSKSDTDVKYYAKICNANVNQPLSAHSVLCFACTCDNMLRVSYHIIIMRVHTHNVMAQGMH